MFRATTAAMAHTSALITALPVITLSATTTRPMEMRTRTQVVVAQRGVVFTTLADWQAMYLSLDF